MSACCGLLAGTTQAQTAAGPPPPSPWYIGVKSAFEGHTFIINDFDTGGLLYTGSAHGGYYFTSNLAVQAGVLYGRGKLNQNQQHAIWGLPVQLRATFSQPERRFQVDGILEATFVHVKRQELQFSYPTSPQVFTLPRQNGFNALLSAGIGLRYGLGQHLQLTSDLLGSTNPDQNIKNYYGFNLGFSTSLGLRYRL
ncbi:outer membrane beta-barrel protein [Hymenobacter sp. BT683]|uniref:Outer membrane beta-barrel protein n=1 Tax=Hymenobacter jeongseonensis TaxID=2791027 RepID=A0ABS0IKQ8_9BACT|nr:outer membrane beta-barrel protein [Hymenobacter jeongseonensis]MBF9238965.1 outer membrane beta-barrel protein [Hymenobacter jeongseonensis]